MDITHYVRAVNKDIDLIKLRKAYNKSYVGLTISNITRQLEQLNESLHENKNS